MVSAPYLYVAHLNFYGIEVVLGEVFVRALFRRGYRRSQKRNDVDPVPYRRVGVGEVRCYG